MECKKSYTNKAKNPDVEYFLKSNCVEFTKKNQSVTYLVMSMEKGEFLGYFTIK